MRISTKHITAWLDTFCKKDDNPRARWIPTKVEFSKTGRNEITITVTDEYGIVEREPLVADLSRGGVIQLDGMFTRVEID